MTRHIDLMHLGHDRVICAYDVDGVIVDPGPTSCLETLLAGLGDTEPRAVLLTHIHLDHASATGSLVERFPDIPVYVHERGAPHMVDPTKLLVSAERLYGESMDRLFGRPVPVPERNVRALAGGETIEGFRVAYTPGHASHHVSYLHEASGDAFCGDVAGNRTPPSVLVMPPTPPPEIDVEAWERSIDLIAEWSPERLCITHFGPFGDVRPHLDELRRSLDSLTARARDADGDEFIAAVTEEIRMGTDDEETAQRFMQAGPPDQFWLGLERYWRKRREWEEAEASA